MPLIMDAHDHYMDDLFGDAPQVQIPQLPILKTLSQRLDDMAGSNACQKITWSKHGVIACVTSSGKGVNTHVLIRNQKTNVWNLSKPVPLPLDLDESANKIVHISWSWLGNDLAIIDSSGRVFIFTTPGILGRLTLTRPGLSDLDIELNAVIGTYWMPIAPYVQKPPVSWSATRSGSNWSYSHEKVMHSMGAFNPKERQGALLVLTKMGTLRLMYQGPNGQYVEKTQELEAQNLTADFCISHAAFAPSREQRLLLATYDNSRRMRVFQLAIAWNPPEVQADAQKAITFPILDVSPLAQEEDCLPQPTNSNHQETITSTAFTSTSLAITHLEIMPQVQTSTIKQPLPATVMAVFSPVSPSSAVMVDPTSQYHATNSTVCRWYIKDGPETRLLPIFDEISNKGKSTSSIDPRKEPCLERQADLYMQAIVLSVSVLRHDTMLSFSLSDGTIEFRFRDSLELASADGNNEEVHTLPQSGFAFPAQDPALHTALSPNICCAAVMQDDGELKLKKMEYVVGNISELKDDEPQFGSVAALMAVVCTSAWVSSSGTDDVVAITPKRISDSLVKSIVENIWVACSQLGATLNLLETSNVRQVYNNGLLLRCLSSQYVLGLGKNSRMTISAKLAWVTLNLKMLSINFLQSIGKSADPSSLRTEVVVHLFGSVKWALDILTYCIQEIFDMNYALGEKANDLDAIKQWIHENSSPVLHLCLCSMPRFFLRNFVSSLRKLYNMGRENVKNSSASTTSNGASAGAASASATGSDPARHQVWMRFVQSFAPSPIIMLLMKSMALDEYFKEMDALVRADYAAANIEGSAARGDIERSLFLRADVPDLLKNAVCKGVLANAAQLAEHMQPGNLYKADIGWLGLTEEATWPEGKEVVVDVIRKWPLGVMTGKKIKRCPRCRSVSEELEIGSQQASLMTWLVQAMRQCVCTNSWILHEEDDGKKTT